MHRAVSCVSSSRARLWFSGVVVVAGLAVASTNWDGFDGRSPDHHEARLVAEGTSGGVRWTVVQVDVRNVGDCLHLRGQGVLLESSCRSPSSSQVKMLTLPGTSRRFVFGMLPAGAARAEFVPEGRSPLPLRVFTYGTSGRYVAEAVSAEPSAAVTTGSGSIIAINLYDAQGRRLGP